MIQCMEGWLHSGRFQNLVNPGRPACSEVRYDRPLVAKKKIQQCNG
jgi:hypothetical protein